MPLLEVVSDVDDELSIDYLMRKAGGPHPHTSRTLQRKLERNFVCLDYLDRIDLAIDRALDHSRDYPATDSTCSIQRHVRDPGPRKQPLVRLIELQIYDRFRYSCKRNASDKGRTVVP